MIYQDVKRYLKRNYQTPSEDYNWAGHDNLKLLNFIQSKYSDEYIENNASEIKQAFRDFFEPICSLIVRFKLDTGVAYKIIPYHIDPKNSKHLNKIIDIIRHNRRAIEYPYKDRDDQIALLGKIRRHINSELIETDEAVNKKELVRYAIKKALELDPRDVVLNFKRKYIVKIFKKNEALNSYAKEPIPKDTEERRFQGYNSEDMSSHYDELVNDIDLKSFLDNVMATLFAGRLNFDEITNNYYEANVLTLIRSRIVEELKPYVSQNNDYILGLAGYIFRNNFAEMHQRMAVEIFECITKKSKNAEKFLSYYSGTIHIEDGKRYSIPEIRTPDGKRWNITSITAIATMWLRSRDAQHKLEVGLENLMQEYTSVSVQYETKAQQLEDVTDRLHGLLEQFQEIEKEILVKRKSFKLKEPGEMDKAKTKQLNNLIKSDQQKLVTIREKIAKLKPMKSALNSEERAMKSRYIELKTKKQSFETEIRTSKQNLDVNSEAFHSILGSLVNTLMQRKKLIKD